MADKLPVGIFVYFIFLSILLVGITVLAVQTLISTATRIGDIRDAILATSTIKETEERIAHYKDVLIKIDQLIAMEANNLSSNLNQSLQAFTEVNNTRANTRQRLKKIIESFQGKIFEWSRANFSRQSGLLYCNKVIFKATTLSSFMNQLNHSVDAYIALDRFETATRALLTVVLPDGAKIYGSDKLNPNITLRPIRLVPNSNDYLASYGAQSSPKYLASPVLADYLRLSVTLSVKQNDPLVISLTSAGDNRSRNLRINTISYVENANQVFDYDLESYFVVPYEVYSQPRRKIT